MINEAGQESTSEVPLRGGPAVLRRGITAGTAFTMVNALAFSGSMFAQSPAPAPAKPAVVAATPASTATGATEMPELVVRGQADAGYKPETVQSRKYTEPLRDVPQTVTVVPEQVIKDQNATTLREVLKNVPGISIQAGEGGVPAGDNLSIRGFNARTDLFVDGVRDIGGYTRDSFNFEQVEVVKGPASAYSGRGSTGGSINMATKRPRADAFYRGDIGFGTDNYKRFTIDVNQPILALWPKPTLSTTPGTDAGGKGYMRPLDGSKSVPALEPAGLDPTVAFRLNAMFTEADVANRNEVEGRRWGVAPSLTFGLGTPTNVTFTYMHLDQDNVPDYGLPWVPATNVPLTRYRNQAAPVDFSNYYGILDRDYEKIVTDVGTFEIKHAFNETNNLRYLLRYGRNSRDSMITAPRFSSDLSTDIRRQLQSRDQEDTILANLLDYTTSFDTWGAKHSLVAGVEYDRENQENHLRAGPDPVVADLYHPNPHVAYRDKVVRTGAVNEADTETLSLFAFDTIKLGEHWQISGGLRYDYYSAELDQRDEAGLVVESDRIDKMLSWRAALAYKPVESGTIYVAAGTSFNPSAEGLTSGFNPANAALKPEKSLTYEVGTKWEFFDKRLLVNLAAFRTEKENARTQGVDNADIVVLDGEQRVQGFEVGVSGNITKEWAVFGGYTFLDSEIKSSNNPAEVGKELPNTPQHSFSLWTTYQLPWKFQVGAGAQYVSERFANAINTRETDNYWSFDAMLKYEVTKYLDLRLNVYNLADEEYIDRVSGGHFVPATGRTGTLTASLKF